MYSSSIEDRFWIKVIKSENCWIWNSYINSSGYGHFKIKGKVKKAHRVAWELTYGPIIDDLFVCHKCDVRNCVRPSHLFLGTNEDNMRDMKAKNREVLPPVTYGESNSRHKLSKIDVDKIKVRILNGDTNLNIAKDYYVHDSTISCIRLGKTWKERI